MIVKQLILLLFSLNQMFSFVLSSGNEVFFHCNTKLNGEHFKVSSHNAPPIQVMTLGDNNTVIGYTGPIPEIFYLVAETLNITFTFVPENDTEIKLIGAVNASLVHRINGGIDINTAGMMSTPDRKKVIDFSYPFWIGPFKLLVPKPGEESRLFAFIRPFQPLVWMFLILVFVAMVAVLSLLSWSYSGQRNNRIGENAIYVITIISNYAGRYHPNFGQRYSYVILVGTWVLAATVLVNCYSGTITSALTVPKMKRAVDSLEELAYMEDTGEVSLSIQPDTILGQNILSAESGLFKILGDQLRSHPERFYETAGKSLWEKIYALKYAIPQSEYYIRTIMATDLKKTGKCRFQMSSSIPLTQLSQFGLPKGAKYNQIITNTVQYLWETGLISYWASSTIPKMSEQCILGLNKKEAAVVPIKKSGLDQRFPHFRHRHWACHLRIFT